MFGELIFRQVKNNSSVEKSFVVLRSFFFILFKTVVKETYFIRFNYLFELH